MAKAIPAVSIIVMFIWLLIEKSLSSMNTSMPIVGKLQNTM